MLAAAAEPSLILSIKVPGYHTCHAGAIKVSMEVTQGWPPLPQPGWLCEWSESLCFSVLSYVFLKQSSHLFQVNCKK